MGTASHISRLSMLAVGLGVGAAVTALPGTASADPLPFDPNDFAISIDGMTLFQVGTASATSDLGDFAIADGANSQAIAEGGFGDFASAYGPSSFAVAGVNGAGASDNDFDFASAVGANSDANAGIHGSFDWASAVGDHVLTQAGFGTTAVPANFDFASVWGNLDTPTLDYADAVDGSNDVAFVVNPFGTIFSEALAAGGNYDLAGAFGEGLTATSIGSDFLFHIEPFF